MMLFKHRFNNQKNSLKTFPRCSQVYVPKMFPRIYLEERCVELWKGLLFCD